MGSPHRKGCPDYAASSSRGEPEGLGNSPKDPITRVSVGIIREAALCRLCRARHNRHTFACRRLLRWYAEGADLDHAVLTLSTYLGHAQVSDTYWYLTGIPELLNLAAARFEHFAVLETGDHT
jgi:integrase